MSGRGLAAAAAGISAGTFNATRSGPAKNGMKALGRRRPSDERIVEHDGLGAARADAHEVDRRTRLGLEEANVRSSGARKLVEHARSFELFLPAFVLDVDGLHE